MRVLYDKEKAILTLFIVILGSLSILYIGVYM